MVERVTIEQIKEACLAKESAKCAFLVHEYVEQNPYIKQKNRRKNNWKLY